ncbi:MAG: DUF2461 domain-containing protein [Bacteroidota bacterium]
MAISSKQKILDFLNDLIQNNSKEWMDKNRSRYHEAKSIFIKEIEEVINQVKLIDPEFIDITAKKSILRINRNLVFSQDKTPYKDNFGASIIREEGRADFYIHISPHECFIAAGFYHPPNEILKLIRQEIDYEREQFLSIVNTPAFAGAYGHLLTEGALKTAPRGYSMDHPLIEYLRLKSYVVMHSISTAEFLANDFVDKVIGLYKEATPLRKFLDTALVEYRS